MPSCSAYNCKTRHTKGKKNATFHMFPHTQPERLKVWVRKMRLKNWEPRRRSVICSRHFEEQYFDRTGQTTRLRENAVPTIFDFPKHLQPKKPRKPPKKREPLANKKKGEIKTEVPTENQIQTENQANKEQNEVVKPTKPCKKQHTKGEGENDTEAPGVKETGEQPQTTTQEKAEAQAGRIGEKSKASPTTTPEIDPAVASAQLMKRCRKPDKSVALDHPYANMMSHKGMKRKVDSAVETITRVTKRLKVSQTKICRLKKRVDVLNASLENYKKDGKLDNVLTRLLGKCSEVPAQLMERLTKKNRGKGSSNYPASLQTFALTLQGHSPKAYKYVRKALDGVLPHPSMVRKWRRNSGKLTELSKDTEPKASVSAKRPTTQKRRVTSVHQIIYTLRDEGLLSEYAAEMLSVTFFGISEESIKNMLNQKYEGKLSKQVYPEVMQKFSKTLYFFSPKAYLFVVRNFDIVLPQMVVIRNWSLTENGEPGFSREAFKALKHKVAEENMRESKVVCSLLLDEVSLEKRLEMDGSETNGFVDFGFGIADDCASLAESAMVLMVVSMNGNWKLPVAYFLVNSMSSSEKASIVRQSLVRLSKVGVHCVALTCNGPANHFPMLESLGAKLRTLPLQPSFPHPTISGQQVYVLLDTCFLMNSLRMSLMSESTIRDSSGGVIKWKYIEELQKLIEYDEVHLGKMKIFDIEWEKHKLKLGRATQSIGDVLADAMLCCSDELRLPQFSGAEATVEFIRYFTDLYDLMNSRNPLGRNFKAPIQSNNAGFFLLFLQQCFEYISSLTDKEGNLLYKSRNRLCYLGFLIGIKSIEGLYSSQVNSSKPFLNKLITHRLSQDHLDLLLEKIKSISGAGNAPTAKQFKTAYRNVMFEGIGRSIAKGKMLSKPSHLLPITSIQSKVPGKTDVQATVELDILLQRRFDLEYHDLGAVTVDCSDVPQVLSSSPYKDYAIENIAKCVLKLFVKGSTCPECREVLVTSDVGSADMELARENRTGILHLSKDFLKICHKAEQELQRLLILRDGSYLEISEIVSCVSQEVLSEMGTKPLFSTLSGHTLDCSPDYNHLFVLIKTIVSHYLQVRLSDL